MADEYLVMWSIGQIAERDGISKAAVSKTAKKLLAEREDTPVERGSQGQVMKISLAHYDEYRQRFFNPAKAKAPIRSVTSSGVSSGTINPSESFDEARRQAEWLKVGRERIRHQEELGQLVRKDMLEAALRATGLEIQRLIGRLQNKADDVALAVSKEGVHGARTALRKIGFDLGNEIADKLLAIAGDHDRAPEFDDPIEAEEQ